MPRRGALRRFGLAALALVLASAGSALAQPASLDVTPTPLSVETIDDARPVTIAGGAVIVAPPGDAEALDVARSLGALVMKTRGLRLRVEAGTAPRRGTAIILARRSDATQGPEGYSLDVANGRVTISASTRAGLYYGAASLWQMMTPDEGRGPVTLAPVRIEDRPRFAWRGLLLDSARHYQSPAFVEQLIDWMSLHKLNILQWHLTDDQGWRLQIAKYPRLTQVGAWRPDVSSNDPKARYGGFYTQAEVRRIVAYAQARNVTIVPEIEMPGHALAAILAHPDLASVPGAAQPGLENDWGVFPYLLAPTDHTLNFLQDVLTEVIDLFPGPYVSIGGDEAVKDEWRGSPAIQAEIKRLGLANEDALQGWLNARIGAFLAAHGRKLVGWDDVLAGGVPADATVLSWHLDGAIAAARAGHDAVIATDPILYFDHRQTDLPSEPPGRGIVVSLADVYRYEPAPATLTPDERAHFIGVQANIWTEHIRTEARVEQMAFPRAAAVAELGWTAPERKDWGAFAARLPAELTRYRPLGLRADPGALAVKLTRQSDPAGGADTIALSNQLGLGQIRYTTDGSAPSAASPVYAKPLPATPPMRVRAATFADRREVSPILDQTLAPAASERRTSQELALCTTKLALDLEAPMAVQGVRPVYLIDIMNPCWTWPAADLTGVGSLTVSVGRLPFNFQLGADLAKIVLRPPTTDQGELEVRTDGCAGDLLASAPLKRASLGAGPAAMTIAIPPHTGRHDLCLSFTGKSVDPMWAVGSVQMNPATPMAEAAR